MTNPTPTESVREIYKRFNGDLLKVAEHLNIPYSKLVQQVGADRTLTLPSRPEPPAALLNWRPAWSGYVVSVRHNDAVLWPHADEAKIKEAREKHDSGEYEMCQRRQDGWTILYCVPRRKAEKPRKFFTFVESFR